MTTTDLPDWIYKGAKVAAVGNGMVGGDIFVTTVERITVAQIVCAGDRRFQRRAPYNMVGTGNYSLEPLSAQHVRDKLACKRLRVLTALVDKAVNVPIGATTADVFAALDVVEKLVANTRAAVEKLSKEN